jgi:hypothetical protein
MTRKASQKNSGAGPQTAAAGPGPLRSTLHEVLRGRKAAPHVPRAQKRQVQKLRRALRDELDLP